MAKKRGRKTEGTDFIVGRNIMLWRRARGMSQTQLAGAIGVAFQQVQKYESGKNRISPSRLQSVAHFLEVPAHALFDGVDAARDARRSPREEALSLYAQPYAARFVEAVARIKSDGVKRSIRLLIEACAD